MGKLFFIPVFTLFFSTVSLSQEEIFIDKDSTLKQSEKGYDTSMKSTSTIPIAEENYVVTEDKEQDTIYIDTTLYYNPLYIAPDSIEAWKNLKSFTYIKYLDSLLKDKQDKERNKGNNDTDNSSPKPGWLNSILSSSEVQIFFWALAAVFVFYISYKLFLTQGVFKKSYKNKNIASPEVSEEIITSESDFNLLIVKAVNKSNYRLAVRYRYLQTLHNLAAKYLIELSPDKTNYQYVREIKNIIYQNDFAALTLNYEYVWYGEFAIEENIYTRIDNEFLKFYIKI